MSGPWRAPGVGEDLQIALGVLALLSFAAIIPLTPLAHQVGNGVIAAVIGVPSAVVGWVVARRPARQSGGPASHRD